MSALLLHQAREALLLVLIVSAPPLLAALVAGAITGTMQAATQVQEASLGAVPRIAAVLGAAAIFGPWMAGRVARFATEALAAVARLGP